MSATGCWLQDDGTSDCRPLGPAAADCGSGRAASAGGLQAASAGGAATSPTARAAPPLSASRAEAASRARRAPCGRRSSAAGRTHPTPQARAWARAHPAPAAEMQRAAGRTLLKCGSGRRPPGRRTHKPPRAHRGGHVPGSPSPAACVRRRVSLQRARHSPVRNGPDAASLLGSRLPARCVSHARDCAAPRPPLVELCCSGSVCVLVVKKIVP